MKTCFPSPRILLRILLLPAVVLCLLIWSGCSEEKDDTDVMNKEETLRQVLYVQDLYNRYPGGEIIPELRAVTDSMRVSGRDPYYFAAVNVLIDRLFSEGRFSETDSLAVRMLAEAEEDRDSLSIAMARRVRGQMLYKLSQTARALDEIEDAEAYLSFPGESRSHFGTATSIYEWMWIISRETGDTSKMNRSGESYAALVDANPERYLSNDSTGHFPVTALSFRAAKAYASGNHAGARQLLDSAAAFVRPGVPSRAYEHLYEVRAAVRAAGGDTRGAVADIDTLLSTHKDFPWFYLKDLLLKARILSMTGRHEESARAYGEYVAFHDSLSNKITDSRLNDLTVLYRSELDQEQQKTQRLRMYGFGSVILFLLLLLVLSLIHASDVRKKNRLLVERLKEADIIKESTYEGTMSETESALSPIERLDRYMYHNRPYTDPAFGRKELAEISGLTQEGVGQLIRNERGMTVKNYIISFRLEEARRVLGSESTETIAELAIRLGFGTARTLQRAFKEHYDMSPTQYREAAKGE